MTVESPGPGVAARAAALAREHVPGAPGKDRFRPARRLRRLEMALAGAVDRLARRRGPGAFTGAAEWILDNQHILLRTLEQIREDLPLSFVRELPTLREGPLAGEPRIRAVARAPVRDHREPVDLDDLRVFLRAYGRVAPLTMGEIWAFPSFLRLAFVEEVMESAVLLAESGVEGDSRAGGYPPDERVPAAMRSLRAVDAEDWEEFFESVSRVEEILRVQDPARLYARMDRRSRDRYRKVVERLARHSPRSEEEVARTAVALAREASPSEPAEPSEPDAGSGSEGAHVGTFLSGPGTGLLEERTGYRSPPAERLGRACRAAAPVLYPGAVVILTLLGAILPTAFVETGPGERVLIAVLALLPVSAVVVAAVNWMAMRLVPPRVLPKLSFREGGIPDDARTCIAVPVLVSGADEVDAVIRQLELNYIGNVDDRIRFVLLTDFSDAPAREMPGDAALLTAVSGAVRELNERYGSGEEGPFLHLHRTRRWSPGQGCWMGWERKRGKLEELNRLLLGSGRHDLRAVVGAPDSLRGIRYVVTLDADTFLPQGAARRMVGALHHPLNRPVTDGEGRVVRGFSILQPRVETVPEQGRVTLFSRIYEVDRGLDLYSHAVSDVYHDLFGRGIYAGKGIYAVAAFEESLRERVPEDSLLSHDLFEGAHGRVGLLSDVAVLEKFPTTVLGYFRRHHRWVRGDWQIAPWLRSRVRSASGERIDNPIPWLGRWQIGDNLRRSLVAPGLFAFLAYGWLAHPEAALLWTLAGAAVLGAPVVLGAATAVRRRVVSPGRWVPPGGEERLPGASLARWGMGLLLLPYQLWVEVDAIVRTVYRLVVSRRELLEWTTSAAQTARETPGAGDAAVHWRRMAAAPVGAVLVGVGLLAMGEPRALAVAAPFLLGWLVAPEMSRRLGRATDPVREALASAEVVRLRILARRTWSFFEELVGPEDHWLAPDHVQEDPATGVAHRTSPTNVGLQLTSILAAHDLGYATVTDTAGALADTLNSLERLERYRGHTLNWHDTRTLEPLRPRYVSTVDSGNLAASLLAVAQGGRELLDATVPGPGAARGIADAVGALRETLADLVPDGSGGAMEELRTAEADLRALTGERAIPSDLGERISELLLAAEEALADRVLDRKEDLDARALRAFREWIRRIGRQQDAVEAELRELVPWLALIDDPPRDVAGPGAPEAARRAWEGVREALPSALALRDVPAACGEALARLESLADVLDVDPARGARPDDPTAWVRRLRDGLIGAGERSRAVVDELLAVAERAHTLVEGMDFAFLYDRRRRQFRVGYHVSTGEADASYYDLLASEARLASFVAIAKGDVPPEHWLHLGRPFGRVGGRAVLLSWSGSMFEYLMPSLFLSAPAGSLLSLSCGAAVDAQVRYGVSRGTPWGVSESAYDRLDARGHYQYRAFGVPALALGRMSGERVVAAPYASALAVAFRPREALRNLRWLVELGGLGGYGLYEALDFGRPELGRRAGPRIVRSYMAHHQGMILASLANVLRGEPLPSRLRADPRLEALDYLLREGAPGHVRITRRRRIGTAPGAVVPVIPSVESWPADPDEQPQPCHVLSNPRFSALLTARGGGGLRWRGLQLTRWSPDPARDGHGSWLYVEEPEGGARWSPSPCPWGGEVEEGEVRFAPHQAEFHGRDEKLALHLTVTVPPDGDLEVRRLTLTNESERGRLLLVTSYGEVSLASPSEDRRHPAFRKLFVESEHDESRSALLFRRRPASDTDLPAHLGHAVVVPGERARIAGWETDREAFLGRDGDPGSPAALRRGTLSGTAGATLDPIFALRIEVELRPGEERTLVFLTGVARSRSGLVRLLDRYRSPTAASWAFEHARAQARARLQALGFRSGEPRRAQRLFSAMAYPYHGLRARLGLDDRGAPRREGLWGLDISGDLPVVLVRAPGSEDTVALREIMRIHAYWRLLGIESDLVILDESADGYRRPLRRWLEEVADELVGAEPLDVSGGVHYVPVGALREASVASLEGAAAVVIRTGGESLDAQLERLARSPVRLPPFFPLPGGDPIPPTAGVGSPPDEDLLFFNGLGGFAPDGREYVIRLEPGAVTPAPWINVVASPSAGFTISERGSGFTWVGNSGEGRLTPWTNDPVLDPPGEAVFIRDEETADVWTPTPGPRPPPAPFRVRHGWGYSIFRHASHGLDQEVELFVHPDEPVKIVEIVLRDLADRPHRLTLTYYAEWVLGTRREISAPHVVTAFDPEREAILARNHFSASGDAEVAFLATDAPVHGWTADRGEFLGDGGIGDPAGLRRIGLAGVDGSGLDPCAALQVHVDLPAGSGRTVRFFLGAARNRAAVGPVLARCREDGAVAAARVEVRERWTTLLEATTVETPEPSMNLLLNGWLLYQALACRLWGRSALYQSSGAFGFRDQLQDVLAVLPVAPEVARAHILEAAAHQFEEGDVLHWWHPPGGAGIRTRCSDDLLWLPFVLAAYVEATGDDDILRVEVPYLRGPALDPGELERYGRFPVSSEGGTLYDHALRALDRGSTRGVHGLPLIGAGDWNDGMDRVGPEGTGESVWLAWFAGSALQRFARICRRVGEPDRARRLEARAEAYARAVEDFAWDGEWYLRATYDDGTPLGTASGEEGRIDSISQSWAVLSGMADATRAARAMESVGDELVDPVHDLVLLLTPPFDRGERTPGYIRAYPPGIRENGGQYTHAAAWVTWAFAALGDADRAEALFRMVNPIHHSDDPEKVETYRAEPYVVAADVAGAPPHIGRGGWTWYTGSAAWIHRVGMEAILGLSPVDGDLRVNPVIPPTWDGFRAVHRRGSTRWEIVVRRGEPGAAPAVYVDGRPLPDGIVPLEDDGDVHRVEVVLAPARAASLP